MAYKYQKINGMIEIPKNQRALDKVMLGSDGKVMVDGVTAFSAADKEKLDGLTPSLFVGTFSSELNLPAAGSAGQSARVDLGVGEDAQSYIWDVDDSTWVKASSEPCIQSDWNATVGDSDEILNKPKVISQSRGPMGGFLIGDGTIEGTGQWAVAIGRDVKSNGNYAVAVGNIAEASNTDSVAIGRKADASASGSVAVGFESEASGNESLSIGKRSKASGPDAVAFGHYALATANQSTAFGYDCSASGNESLCIGMKTESPGSASVAVGPYCKANGDYSIALGKSSRASVANSNAIGREAVTSYWNMPSAPAINIGAYNRCNVGYQINIGNNIYKNHDSEGIVLGHESNEQSNGIAVGHDSTAWDGGITIGNNIDGGKQDLIIITDTSRAVSIASNGITMAAGQNSLKVDYGDLIINDVLVPKTDIEIATKVNAGTTYQLLTQTEYNSLLEKTADGWNDLIGNFSKGKLPPSSAPAWEEFIAGFSAYSFEIGDSIQVEMHVEHDYKNLSDFFPHVHWMSQTGEPNAVAWELSYTVAKGHQQTVGSVFTTGTVMPVLSQTPEATPLTHMVVEDENGQSDSKFEVDSFLYLNIKRVSNGTGTEHVGKVFGITADIHYQTDRNSTKNRLPDFYA